MGSPRAFGRTLVLALVVAAAVLPASAQSPAAGEAVLGPELPVSRPVPGAPRESSEQAVAYGGGVFLVAWIDGYQQLWATRVDRSGAVIDQSGIRLSALHSAGPAVAFDGTNFLVAWAGPGVIQGLRVSPDGVVLDADPIELSPTAGGPEVSFGGGNFLVVWPTQTDETGAMTLNGTRVSPEGVVLQPANVPIVTPELGHHEIDIAFDGTHHLLVWSQGDSYTRDIHGTLVTTDGVALGPDQPISTAEGAQDQPVVTATDSGFFVAWRDLRQGSDIFAARVRPDGSVVDGAGIRLGYEADSPYYTPHDVAWDGVNALVTWPVGDGDTAAIRGARVDPSGTLLDPDGVELTSGWYPALAFDGTHHLLTSVTRRALTRNVKGSRLTPGLAPLDPGNFDIAIGANRQTDVDLVFDGADHFVVWIDNPDFRPRVYGARIGPEGQLLDGAGFAISVPAEPAVSIERVSVAFDGTNFLVVWLEGGERPAIRAARISRSGQVLGRFDISAGYPTNVTVAFGHGVFLVVWAELDALIAARVDTEGAVLDPGGFTVGAGLTDVPAIDIVAGASDFLVVWDNGWYTDPGYDNDVLGAVVTPEGTVARPDIPIASGERNEQDARVAWHDGTYLVVWADLAEYWPPGTSDIHGARLDVSGTVLDPAAIPISTAPDDQRSPDVATANGRFLVTWTDRRRSTGFADLAADVYGTTVDPAGTVGSELLIGATDRAAGAAVVTSRPGDDDFAVVYGRDVPDEPYGTTRAFLRRVSPK